MTVDAADAKRISPGLYLAGHKTLSRLAEIVAGLGTTPLVMHGENGIQQAVRQNEKPLLASPRYRHRGPCTEQAIDAASHAIDGGNADVVIAVGGGRVLDVAKAAADQARVSVVTVPTSPATCAAMTALTVIYDDRGRWLRGRVLDSAPSATVIDLDVLRTAPSRLVAAGTLDAIAKTHEVRLALNHSNSARPTETAAISLCDRLDSIIDGSAALVFGAAGASDEATALDTLMESAIAFPGWIGGMAGEANKLAAAHAVHNAFTMLPGSKRSLHGELVGFGVVVQTLLQGDDPAHINHLIRLSRAPSSLTELGCAAFLEDPASQASVLDRILRAPAVQSAFPDLSADALAQCMYRADEMLAKP